MSGSIYLWLGGLFNLAFFIFHIFFWKIFNWRNDLKKLEPINRAIMQVLNLCLMFCLLIFAYVSFFHAYEIMTTNLGKCLALAIAVFWGLRAIFQYVFFSRKKLLSHILFVIFAIICWLYLMVWLA